MDSNPAAGILPQRAFPFPKSLYAVEDTLRFFVSGKPALSLSTSSAAQQPLATR